MSHTYWQLKAMPIEQLVDNHDKLAEHTSVGVSYYLDELHRREVERHAGAIRTAVAFVDAGYLRQRAAAAVAAPSSEVALRGDPLLRWLHESLRERFIRAYVYDANYGEGDGPAGARERIGAQHTDLRETFGIHLRLGALVGSPPRQKGVDTRLSLDMLEMAQLGAYDTAVLISGDADIAEAVEAVQRLGRIVRVVLIGDGSGLSSRLRELSDEPMVMLEDELKDLVAVAVGPA
jgi:uncharacterized LabA/DUF88 family protein